MRTAIMVAVLVCGLAVAAVSAATPEAAHQGPATSAKATNPKAKKRVHRHAHGTHHGAKPRTGETSGGDR